MNPALSTAVSGLMTQQTRLDVHAHNIANANTPGFKASRLSQSEVAGGGTQVASITRDASPGPLEDVDGAYEESSNTDLASEMVGLITAQRGFEANLPVIRTQDKMIGSLLDILA
ncbi:MAG: flagellar basal body rod protein FlgC [Planctomycetota bacterium]